MKELGYEVFGMSTDNPNPQKNWKTKQKLPFNLLCDPTGVALKAFGVFKAPKSTVRSVVIIKKGGVVTKIASPISPLDSVSLALETAKL